MNFDWKGIVRTVAPMLGTALGGPMAGAATKFIAEKFLGNREATENDIANYLNTASPEELIKLKELDKTFQLEMKKLDVDVYRIDATDRDSARKRQTELRDWTPNIIAIIYMLFFFGTIYYFGRDGLLEQENVLLARLQDILLIMVTFFFGSSAGSRIKDYFNKK